MYCKKCGRKLEDGARFCKRCGQSVRQNHNTGKEARRKEIAKLKKERLDRKQKLQEQEIEKKLKKQKNKKKNQKRVVVLAVSFVVLLCILIIAVITYFSAINQSKDAAWRTKDGSVELNATAVPRQTQTPKPENSSGMPTATAYAITGEVNADGYREYTYGGNLILPYPATFEQQRTESGEKLRLYDKSGGASIVLKDEGPVSTQAKELMSEYAKAQPGKISYSRAGDGWYIVEAVENDIVYHRKCLVINNRMVYYDFSYSTTSSAASTYKTQIEYMDEHFSR